MACKTKKLKLRKYSKGSRLPKVQTGMDLSYADQSAQIFTPNSNQYNTLSSYNQYQNTQQFGPGVNAQPGDFIQSDANNVPANVNNMNANGMFGTSFGDTQYGDTNISGGLTAVGLAGTLGSETIKSNMTSEQQQYGNTDTSWSQSLVGAAGPWGSAISGVSQLGASALESGVDYDEYGYAENQSYNQFAKSLETGLLDPAQNLDVVFSDEYSTGERIGAALLPGLAGIFQADQEQEDAKAREEAARQARYDAMNTAKRKELESNTITYGGLAKYGGKLKKYQNGGDIPIGTDPNTGKTIYSKSTPNVQTATAYTNTLRPVTQNTAQMNVTNDLGISKEDFYNNLSNEYLDSLVGVYRDKYLAGNIPYQVQRAEDSMGNLTLNKLVPDKRTKQKYGGNLDYMNPSINDRPTVFKYTGQTHNGADEGIEVDGTGIPSIMSGKAPVALTEREEVAYKGPDMESAYIFSDSIKYKK